MARVGIDLDGVVYDFVESLREYMHEVHRWSYSHMPEATRWEFFLDWGLSRENFLSYCRRGVAEGYIFTIGKPSEGAVEALRAIREAGHTLVIVTDRASISLRAREATISWLRKHGIEYDELHLTGDKASIDLDYMVDDRLENYDALDAAGVKVFLWNQKWNEDDAKERRRVSTWNEYLFVLGVKDLDQVFPGSGWSVQPMHDPYRCAHGAPNHACTPESHATKEQAEAQMKKFFESVNEEVRVTSKTGGVGAVMGEVNNNGEVRVVSATGGAKGTKPARFGLIPPMALWKVAELYGKGAEKYADWNWRKGYDWHLSYDAMQRHLALFWSGEDLDPETGMPHLACAAFHCLTLLTFMDEHPEFDDRFKAGEH